MVRLFVSLLFLLSLVSLPAWAWPPKYGAEFTFSPNDGTFIAADTQGIDRVAARVRMTCPACQFTRTTSGGVRVTVPPGQGQPGGWWFEVNFDVGVIEVQTQPATLAELKVRQASMQSLIFDSARDAGYFPHDVNGGGHIHMDFDETFGGDARLFRNFMADYANHPELARVFGRDPYNAPTLMDLSPEQRTAFSKVLSDFDHSEPPWSIHELVDRIQTDVYTKTAHSEFIQARKYQAISLKRVNDVHTPVGEHTMEMRAIGPQKSAGEFVRETELFENRISYLKRQPGAVPYDPGAQLPGAADLSRNFTRYVQESGLDPAPYHEMVRDVEMSAHVPVDSGTLIGRCRMRIRSAASKLFW